VFPYRIFCQTNSNNTQKNNNKDYYTFVDIPPTFPGGEEKLYSFLHSNLDKQKMDLNKATGTIVATFVVDSLGYIKDIKILKSLDTIADKEFIRVIALMPKWRPGKYKMKSVPVQFNLPLRVPYEK
jgi:protein TonB